MSSPSLGWSDPSVAFVLPSTDFGPIDLGDGFALKGFAAGHGEWFMAVSIRLLRSSWIFGSKCIAERNSDGDNIVCGSAGSLIRLHYSEARAKPKTNRSNRNHTERAYNKFARVFGRGTESGM